MKKDYNRLTTSDMPLDSSFTPTVEVSKPKTSAKPKINAIGKSTTNKAKSASTKTSASKTASKTTKTTTKSGTKSASESEQKVKTKLAKSNEEINDLEKLNEENIKSYRYKSKRSKVVIVLLAVFLAIAIAIIGVYIGIIKLDANCYLNASGAEAVFIVDGEEMSKFRTPSNLQGNRTLKVDIKLKIEEGGEFKIKFILNGYQNKSPIENTLAYLHGDLFYDGGDGYYYSKGTISGNQTIQLCEGIILDYYYENTLNANNFKLDFDVYLEKIPG